MICILCAKGPRALLYCHRPGCPRLIAAADLPRPTVEVTSREEGDGLSLGHRVDVTISRGNAGKKYEGGKTGGYSHDGALKDVIEQIIADPYTAEWLPAREPAKKGG